MTRKEWNLYRMEAIKCAYSRVQHIPHVLSLSSVYENVLAEILSDLDAWNDEVEMAVQNVREEVRVSLITGEQSDLPREVFDAVASQMELEAAESRAHDATP